MAKKSKSVVVHNDQREFRKTNEAIGLRVKEGNFTLLKRKVFNVMMFHAQKQVNPGMNAPIDTPSASKYFWIPLSELAKDSSYNSRDTAFLKGQLEELLDIKLQMESDRQWTSERLVSSITIVNPDGARSNSKHAGQVWLGFAFPPEVHELVMLPGEYTRMSIVYQGLLSSGTALALYEICRRFATNPSKVTNKATIEHWFNVLSGNTLNQDQLPPYKYFKRDVLKPAIEQINAFTDITIELIEDKDGTRRVQYLQFRVEQTKQTQLEFSAPPVINLDLVERLMRIGFTQNDATNMSVQHSEFELLDALTFVEQRMAAKNSSQLDSPPAYLRWVLKNKRTPNLKIDTTIVEVEKAGSSNSPIEPESEPETMSLHDRFYAVRSQDAYLAYCELSPVEKKSVLKRFKDTNENKLLKLTKGLENPMVRSAFSMWYAKELWGEPSEADFSRFSELENQQSPNRPT